MTLLVGRKTGGTTADFVGSGNAAYCDFVAAASGEVRTIFFHPKVANPSLSTAQLGIYAADGAGGIPGTRLGFATATAFGSTGIFAAVLASSVTVTSGVTYWLAWDSAGEQFDFQGENTGSYREVAAGSLDAFFAGGGSVTANHEPIIWAEDIVVPRVVAVGTLADAAAGTNHSVPLPAPAGGILADDLLIACVGQDAAAGGTIGWPDGTWNELLDTRDATNVVNAGVAWKRAAGGESGNVTITTSASEGGGIRILCVRGAHLTSAPELTSATASSTNPNPPSETASWGAEFNLFIAGAANDGNVAITAAPAGFSDFGNTRWANTAGAGVATATALSETAALDPGTFTMATEQWVAFTVVVRPVAVVSGTTLSPASLTRTRDLGSPTVSPQVLPAGQARTRALGSPHVDPKLPPASLTRTRALGSPTVKVAVLMAALVRTRALGTPTISPQVLPASITRTRALGTIVVADGLATILAPAALERTRALGSPAVNPQLLPASLARTRVLVAPGVDDGSGAAATGGAYRQLLGVGS